jgi:hypothetical protein
MAVKFRLPFGGIKNSYKKDFVRSQSYIARNMKSWGRAEKSGFMQFESARDEIAAAFVEGMRAERRRFARETAGEPDV